MGKKASTKGKKPSDNESTKSSLYTIECVIKEFEINLTNDCIFLKIKGIEGYLLHQGLKDFNIFCPKNLKESVEKKGSVTPNVIALDAEKIISVKKDDKLLTFLPNTFGHKVKIEIEMGDSDELVCCGITIING